MKRYKSATHTQTHYSVPDVSFYGQYSFVGPAGRKCAVVLVVYNVIIISNVRARDGGGVAAE